MGNEQKDLSVVWCFVGYFCIFQVTKFQDFITLRRSTVVLLWNSLAPTPPLVSIKICKNGLEEKGHPEKRWENTAAPYSSSFGRGSEVWAELQILGGFS